MSMTVASPAPNSVAAPVPPGPSATVLPGQTDDPLRFLLDLTHQYGDLVRYETPYSYTYIANSPETIFHVLRDPNYPRGSLLKQVLGEGLLSSEGDLWKKHRSLMVPDFHPRVLSSHTHQIQAAVLDFAHRWKEYSRRGETFNAAD